MPFFPKILNIFALKREFNSLGICHCFAKFWKCWKFLKFSAKNYPWKVQFWTISPQFASKNSFFAGKFGKFQKLPEKSKIFFSGEVFGRKFEKLKKKINSLGNWTFPQKLKIFPLKSQMNSLGNWFFPKNLKIFPWKVTHIFKNCLKKAKFFYPVPHGKW